MFGVPDISVQDVAAKLANGDDFILLDVREAQELAFAHLGDDVTHVPLSHLAQQQLEALPDEIRNNQEAEIVVLCHHGSRSAQVTGWLRQQGWTNVLNMAGGIDAYAMRVDSSVGRY
jgi:rhodanese-related sulfurtransferase